jgi:hypothetical protein
VGINYRVTGFRVLAFSVSSYFTARGPQ